MATIGLVRHGFTDWNKEGRMQGMHDIPLNDEGREQAERLGLRMAQENWDYIYSSQLNRARETAEIIAQHMGLTVEEPEERLAERAFGLLEGTTEEDRILHWGPGWRDAEHQGESRQEVEHRILSFLEEVHHRHPGKRVLVITHGAVIGIVMEKLFPDFGRTPLLNTCVNILRKQEERWECLLHNCVKHLETVCE